MVPYLGWALLSDESEELELDEDDDDEEELPELDEDERLEDAADFLGLAGLLGLPLLGLNFLVWFLVVLLNSKGSKLKLYTEISVFKLVHKLQAKIKSLYYPVFEYAKAQR